MCWQVYPNRRLCEFSITTPAGCQSLAITTGAYHMPRDNWRSAEGKAEAKAESAKGVAAFQRQRDERKQQRRSHCMIAAWTQTR